jgi:hypothetical protein
MLGVGFETERLDGAQRIGAALLLDGLFDEVERS